MRKEKVCKININIIDILVLCAMSFQTKSIPFLIFKVMYRKINCIYSENVNR